RCGDEGQELVEVSEAEGRFGRSPPWWAHVRDQPARPAVEGEAGMTLQGEYVPSAAQWVRDQVEGYERSGGREANTLRDTGLPVIIVTMRGNKTGKIRKIALMRVAHDGDYALVASKGGAPEHPVWYYNLTAQPDEVTIQDGA